ncbi:hypothetical protein ACP70R_030373 [Stipagrostis hirtigluma subsp. patula]
MQAMAGNVNSSKRKRGDQQERQSSAKRFNGSIEAKAFSCDACTQPLSPPIFQCPRAHFFCSPCNGKLLEKMCDICSGCAIVERSYTMERVVPSILVDCCYTKHGCTHKAAYYESEAHERECPHAPCFCPDSGCGFAGRPAELLDHLTAHHRWPATTFDYYQRFDLPVRSGVHVLVSKDEGQLFLVHMAPLSEPFGGHAISVVCVKPCIARSMFRCSVSFSCSARHRGTWTLDQLSCLSLSDWPPTDNLCLVPKVPGRDLVLKFIITCADLHDDLDIHEGYSSYDEDEEEDGEEDDIEDGDEEEEEDDGGYVEERAPFGNSLDCWCCRCAGMLGNVFGLFPATAAAEGSSSASCRMGLSYPVS